jgi:hypothetical protein
MPVNSIICEVGEIRRILVQGQPGKIVRPYLNQELGMVVHA